MSEHFIVNYGMSAWTGRGDSADILRANGSIFRVLCGHLL